MSDPTVPGLVAWGERHQVALYLAALAVGGAAGLLVPTIAGPAEAALAPVLALLLYATFLGVPFVQLTAALRDVRFLTTVLLVNFVLVPLSSGRCRAWSPTIRPSSWACCS